MSERRLHSRLVYCRALLLTMSLGLRCALSTFDSTDGYSQRLAGQIASLKGPYM